MNVEYLISAPKSVSLGEKPQYYALQTHIETGHKTMQEIGIDPYAQTTRAQNLIHALGPDLGKAVALKEHWDNEEAYNIEFIHDSPVSKVHTYYSYNNELYTYPCKHNLLKIRSSIHPGERDGKTLEGFKKFEELVHNENVHAAVWYSPPGNAGEKPPFNSIFFDSGRLYLAIKQDNNSSLHLDIKLDERLFPAKQLLDFLSEGQDFKAKNTLEYLTHPIGFEDENTLLQKLADFPLIAWQDPTTYISRRNDPDREIHKWSDLIKKVEISFEEAAHESNIIYQPTTKHTPSHTQLTDPEFVKNSYYALMKKFMLATGRSELYLYGCSATGLVKSSNGAVSLSASLPSHYSTAERMNSASSSSEKTLKCRCPSCDNDVEAVIREKTITCPKCNATAPYAC